MFNIEISGAIGVLTTLIIQGLKKAPHIPLVAGQTVRIRAAAAVLAFLGNLGTAVADGNVDAQNLVAGTIASFLVSFAVFHGVIADPNKPRA